MAITKVFCFDRRNKRAKNYSFKYIQKKKNYVKKTIIIIGKLYIQFLNHFYTNLIKRLER